MHRREAATSFSEWDRDADRARLGEEEVGRRRGAIMAEQWGYQLAEQRKRLGFTQAGLAEIMGVAAPSVPRSTRCSASVARSGRVPTHVTETVYRHVIVPASRHYSASGSYGPYREWRVRRNEAFIRPMPVMPR